jgi:hypothetical protein
MNITDFSPDWRTRKREKDRVRSQQNRARDRELRSAGVKVAPRRTGDGDLSDFQAATREANVQVSQRMLALLIKHHGDSPPDLSARLAVEKIREQCFKPRIMRKAKSNDRPVSLVCYEVQEAETERLLQEAVEKELTNSRNAQRQKIIARIERAREVAKVYLKKNMLDIAEDVARKHGVTVNDLTGKERKFNLARREAIWRCLKETGQSSVRVGWFFNRDHSTILYAVNAFNRSCGNGFSTPLAHSPQREQ